MKSTPNQADSLWKKDAASPPAARLAPGGAPAQVDGDPKLADLLSRINSLTTAKPKATPKSAPKPVAEAGPQEASGDWEPPPLNDVFIPIEPASFQAAELTDGEVEALILKYLLNRGDATGRDIADQIRLPFVLLDELLRELKQEQLVVYRNSATAGDYVYQLTDLGRERAKRYHEHCTYFGAAPVSLEEYIVSVEAQSLERQHPTVEQLRAAFGDLLINDRMFGRLGPAINSGRGMFLYGFPGNGKTSIAERVTRSFGQYIWIPRSLGVDGEIIRLFDPVNHEEAPPPKGSGLLDNSRIDKRWVRIRRPTIVVGGELTMDGLEVIRERPRTSNVSEASLQMKSNCGCAADRRLRPPTDRARDELLNRWIVPLEKRYDFLNLPNGKKIQVPFDQLIVFSTNLEPRDLVDEAFLRRIPYKIEVIDPTEQEFRDLFRLMCPKLGVDYDESAVSYLIETHYKATGRPFRCCQPRDLLMQIKSHCLYTKAAPALTPEAFDFACENYFAVM